MSQAPTATSSPAVPGPSASSKATPSNAAADVAQRLKDRGVRLSVTEYDPRFDGTVDSQAILTDLLVSHLGLRRLQQQQQQQQQQRGGGGGCDTEDGDGAAMERCVKGLVDAFDGRYQKEDQFNITLFTAMARCFETDNGSKFSVEYFPPKEEWSEAKKIYPQFMVITKREKRKDAGEPYDNVEREDDGDEEARLSDERGAPPDEDAAVSAALHPAENFVVMTGRSTGSSSSVTENKRRRMLTGARQGGGTEGGSSEVGGGGGDGGDGWEPFLAHVQFPADSSVIAAEANKAAKRGDVAATDAVREEVSGPTTQGQLPPPQRRVQRREYALGIGREICLPENRYRIVRYTSRLDHAVVVFSRDPNDKAKKEHGGWSVCQVLATVEIKMGDTTCHDVARLKSDDLAKRKASPLGQEVLYMLGHVVWSRAALGIVLPPSLPIAVVAARKVGMDNSEKMRWVYGNLIVPEVCGGKFTFNVSSFGKFQGTAPESAAAAYVTVLLAGLEAGERWMERMLARTATTQTAPPTRPFHGDGQEPLPADYDTRPRPRSLCGRRLYFGGSPLEMADMTLVATPARMCLMEVPASQGELYSGRVNLAELRDPRKGWSRNVLWCPQATRIGDSSQREADCADDSVRQKAPSMSRPWETSTAAAQENLTPAASALENVATRSETETEEAVRADRAVIIKVTSLACHSMLVLPERALLWQLAKEFGWLKVVQNILPLISESLHAVHLTGSFNRTQGLVQIMPDLRAAGYVPLRPTEILDRRLMCEAFKSLVEQTLVPLAVHGVVHTDLRSRYKETANILCRSQNNDYSMVLIDLDSLMEFRHYEHLPEDKRIISPENGPLSEGIRSALEFVCLQSVCIATSWLIGKEMADQASDESAPSKLDEELNTETIIEKFLLANVKRGEQFEEHEREVFFSSLESDPWPFVLRQVAPILDAFLGV